MNPELITSLAKHGALQPHHIDKILDSGEVYNIVSALKSKSASASNIERGLQNPNNYVRNKVLKSPNVTSEQVNARHPVETNTYVRNVLLAHPKLSRENIQSSLDKEESAVLHNPNISSDDIQKALRNPNLVKEAMGTDAFHGDHSHLASMIHPDATDNMKAQAAAHWQISPEQSEQLYHHPKTPMIAKLNVLTNYKASDDLIRKEVNNPDEIISAYAKNAFKRRYLK